MQSSRPRSIWYEACAASGHAMAYAASPRPAGSRTRNKPFGWRRNLGLDLKYGLGPAFTLSATLNPDFGQVEADPSSVNLSANELFFAEKRTFFLEGSDLFKLPIGNGDNPSEGAFYSRRIGAAPPEPDDHDFLEAPQSTTIYGSTGPEGSRHDQAYTGGFSSAALDRGAALGVPSRLQRIRDLEPRPDQRHAR